MKLSESIKEQNILIEEILREGFKIHQTTSLSFEFEMNGYVNWIGVKIGRKKDCNTTYLLERTSIDLITTEQMKYRHAQTPAPVIERLTKLLEEIKNIDLSPKYIAVRNICIQAIGKEFYYLRNEEYTKVKVSKIDAKGAHGSINKKQSVLNLSNLFIKEEI